VTTLPCVRLILFESYCIKVTSQDDVSPKGQEENDRFFELGAFLCQCILNGDDNLAKIRSIMFNPIRHIEAMLLENSLIRTGQSPF